jgi:hypothetical protein
MCILAAGLGMFFAYTHTLYWTQAGNCSPCQPELFTRSIALGAAFLGVAGVVWLLDEISDYSPRHAQRVAKLVIAGMLISLATTIALVGLVVLPVVAVLGSVAFLSLPARDLVARFRGHANH